MNSAKWIALWKRMSLTQASTRLTSWFNGLTVLSRPVVALVAPIAGVLLFASATADATVETHPAAAAAHSLSQTLIVSSTFSPILDPIQGSPGWKNSSTFIGAPRRSISTSTCASPTRTNWTTGCYPPSRFAKPNAGFTRRGITASASIPMRPASRRFWPASNSSATASPSIPFTGEQDAKLCREPFGYNPFSGPIRGARIQRIAGQIEP